MVWTALARAQGPARLSVAGQDKDRRSFALAMLTWCPQAESFYKQRRDQRGTERETSAVADHVLLL
jgi:hypothetical protein